RLTGSYARPAGSVFDLSSAAEVADVEPGWAVPDLVLAREADALAAAMGEVRPAQGLAGGAGDGLGGALERCPAGPRAGEAGSAQQAAVLDDQHQDEDARARCHDSDEHVGPPHPGLPHRSRWGLIGFSGVGLDPHVFESAEAEFLVVVEARVVDPAHVLLAVVGGEGVVGIRRLPAVDHEVAAGRFDVTEELGADVAACSREELRPVPVRPVDLLEVGRLAHVVAEHEGDHAKQDKVRSVSAEPVAETDDRAKYAGVLRFYELAKRVEWQVGELPWGQLPPVPEGKGSPERMARRRDIWRSVVMQQLQADIIACEMSAQLLNAAPDPEARLYYSTMVQDESRHTEGWLKLI